MNSPSEAQWEQVERLADEISQLPVGERVLRLSALASAGESSVVLTLLGTWLELPAIPPPFSAGKRVGGRYVLREKLGEGGMGSVWRAQQELIGRDVALKLIHPQLVTPALQAQFLAEMQILGQLDHPGIVRIFDAGIHEMPMVSSIPFFAMELIDGKPLDQWAAGHRTRPAELLRVASRICAALGNAHEKQIVHRDLKPRNVLVGNSGQPIVLDFGIARLRGFVLGQAEGMFSGTPQYAAPEQHLGRDQDFRSGESVDIYAVGSILFEMFSGRKLLEFKHGAPISEMRRVVLEGAPFRLSEVLDNCPPGLEEIVSKAVRRDPIDRFYSMASLGRAIDRVAQSIDSPQPVLPAWRPAPQSSIPGTNWVLQQKIGDGGAGEVWIGVHNQLGERRVFKFCDTEEKARTLKREATLFRLLKERVGRNPHFITLHEVSLDEPPWYLMMDHVEARELEAWCAAQAGGLPGIPEAQRLEIVIQAAEALQAAHEAGILHRDIKPANLLVRGDVEHGLHVFVADFGIGQIITDQLLSDRTRLGFTKTVSDLRRERLAGTLLYLAPEVLEGGAASVRSDIYSLGVVLWQLLAGNLHAALDPADWPLRVSDPILQEYLHRCLAGVPEKRWTSTGALAASLRALPERRAAEDRRRAEIASRERAAYRRGLVRAAGVGVGVIAVITALAVIAVFQRRQAERARGEIALEQVQSLSSRVTMGRRARGLELLDLAAKTGTNLAGLRTAAASVLALEDLDRVAGKDNAPQRSPWPASHVPKASGETCRAVANNGALLAVARDVDGLNGAVDLFDAQSGQLRVSSTRRDFPWIPIAEPGMLCFSPDDKLLAVGGAATSRHIVILNTTNGAMQCYAFHGSDPCSCAWHPGGRLLAAGCSDGTIRIWDITAARSARQTASTTNTFDLPPTLDVPALDSPLFILQGQRGPVEHLAFGKSGKWLAALDRAGYLRILSGFPQEPFSQSFYDSDKNDSATKAPEVPGPVIETRIDAPEQVSGFVAESDSVIITRQNSTHELFRILPCELPEELQLAPYLIRIAWNEEGSELCAISLTDVYWLHSLPLALFFEATGQNPAGIACDFKQGLWLLPTENRLDCLRLAPKGLRWVLETNSSPELTEAVNGQGVRSSITSTSDGRVAVYYGHRIQFFLGESPAPLASIVAQGGDAVFQDIVWDTTGRLLGALFTQTNGLTRVESWKTSRDFPPRCDSLPVRSLECERVIPANDGQNYYGRGVRQGLFRFDPATGAQVTVDNSNAARQNAPLACSKDGGFLAMVVDRNVVRLLRMPEGILFADLHSPRFSAISLLCWDNCGSRLAGVTEDGHLQVWNLAPWQQWLVAHHLDN